MKIPVYLSLSRHSIYYFRWPLRSEQSGLRTTLRISLRTRCPDRAYDLARYLASCGRLIRDNNELAKLRLNEIRKLADRYFRKALDQYLSRLDNHELSSGALEDMRHEMELHEDFLGFNKEDPKAGLHPQYLPVESFKRQSGLSDQDWTENERHLILEMRKARLGVLKRVLSAAEELDVYFEDNPAPSGKSPSAAKYGDLGTVVETFRQEHSRTLSDGMMQKLNASLGIMLEFFGNDRPIEEIDRQSASSLKQTVMQLPKNWKTAPKTRGKSLLNAIAVEGAEKISVKTVNGHIDAFRRFFDWAEKNGHAPDMLFDGMKVATPKNEEPAREPFTRQEAFEIYSNLVATGNGLVKKEHHKWGALIGLFTGARVNEVAQLKVSDIKQDGEIWYFNITPEGERQKLKTRAAKRKVPVHSHLIELGFLDYMNKQNPNGRLFPHFSYNKKDGYGRTLSRWFNGSFLLRLGIKRSENAFHSYRHTMIQTLAWAGVEEPIYQQLVGHERVGVTQNVYNAKGYTLAQLKEAIEHFIIEGDFD